MRETDRQQLRMVGWFLIIPLLLSCVSIPYVLEDKKDNKYPTVVTVQQAVKWIQARVVYKSYGTVMYLGGDNSLVVIDGPQHVLEKGYANCVEMSQLLIAVLDYNHIKAYSYVMDLPNQSYHHCIVYVPDMKLWADPTELTDNVYRNKPPYRGLWMGDIQVSND